MFGALYFGQAVFGRAGTTDVLALVRSATDATTLADSVARTLSGTPTTQSARLGLARLGGVRLGSSTATAPAVPTVNRSRHLGVFGSRAVIINTPRGAAITASGARRAVITHGTLGLTLAAHSLRVTITSSGTRAAVVTAHRQAAVIAPGARRAVITQHQTRGS